MDMNDPINSIYSYVERAYVRLQAGDLLIRCLEDNSSVPIQQLVEGFVLTGPPGMDALRETLAEARRRKAQLRDDLRQLMNDLFSNLKSYGLDFGNDFDEAIIFHDAEFDLPNLLEQQGVFDIETRQSCVRLLDDSKALVENLISRLGLLDEIENYLEDWFWGVAYQSAHSEWDGGGF